LGVSVAAFPWTVKLFETRPSGGKPRLRRETVEHFDPKSLKALRRVLLDEIEEHRGDTDVDLSHWNIEVRRKNGQIVCKFTVTPDGENQRTDK
jgi:hypothetical protein